LTSVEQLLVEHVGRGEWLDLAAADEAVDEAAMRLWGESRTCRAVVIRDILRARLAPDPDPHGLRLRGARITGRLDLEDLITDVSLDLKDCLLEEGVLARDARLAGVALIGCRLGHPAEPPLDAARLTCSMLMLGGARIIGHAGAGAVNLNGADIGGSLNCDGAELRNDTGPALFASSVQVGQGMFLRGFTATGAGDLGTVRVNGARIGANFECDGASLRNDTGPALDARSLQVGQNMFLRGGFTATGAGSDGAVRLIGARIGLSFECGASLRNDTGPALFASSLQVGQGMFLGTRFTAIGSGDVAVNLTDARVGGRLYFDPGRLEHRTDSHGRIAVDGLTYTGVPTPISAQNWLDLLRHGTRHYAAQPYQQLAAGYRALGNERQARQIAMAQRDDELTRTGTRWPERLWGKITKVTLGYGYQPWRALLFLAAVVVISCLLAVTLGSHGALAQTSNTATPGRPCTAIQQLSVGLDLNLPVGTSLARAGCGLTQDAASATAAWLTAIGWVLRLLAWVFAALFIAGFTTAIRKT
jgi:hypothetical protein